MKKVILLNMLILILKITYVNAQSTTSNAIGFGHLYGTPLDYLGYTNAGPLDFQTSGLLRMKIYDVPGPPPFNAGFVGIGNTFSPTFPFWRLDVEDNINIKPTAVNYINQGYRVNDTLALYLPGGPSNWCNTFVGRSGNINLNPLLATPGRDDTYLGFDAALHTSNSAQQNVIIGVRAGQQIDFTTGATYIGYEAGLSNSFASSTGSDYNTFVGWKSGWSDVTSAGNAFLGKESGFFNQNGSWNTLIGFHAGFNNTVDNNTFVGSSSGTGNTIGSLNTFVGWSSGSGNTINGRNTFIGSDVASVNPSGEDNTFVGALSGKFNKGSYNTYLGNQAGHLSNLSANTYNTMLGYISGYYNQSSANSFVGSWSGEFHNTGNSNTYIGYKAQYIPTTITDPLNNLTNSAAIGANSIVTGNNQMILGSSVTTATIVNVGIGLSGNPTGPLSRLEIDGTGALTPSGLKFRILNAGSIPVPNVGNQGVLALDLTGNIIYVPDGGGFGSCGIGNPPTQPPILTTHVGLNFNEWSVYFKDPLSPPALATTNNEVGIGYNCADPLFAKLDVVSKTVTNTAATPPYDFTDQYAGRFYETGTYSSASPPPVMDFVGVRGESDVKDVPALAKHNNIGGDFYASQALATNIGARGTANVLVIPLAPAINIGLKGIAANGTVNYGVFGDLGGALICPAGPVPPTAPCAAVTPNFAGFFNGDVGSTTGYWVTSDANLKENIEDLSNPLSVIRQLRPKSYSFKQQQNASMQLPSGNHFGLLAQDLLNVLPQLVKPSIFPARYNALGKKTHDEIKYNAVNYTELTAFLIGGIQQQQKQIEQQQTQLDSQQAQIDSLKEILKQYTAATTLAKAK